MSEPSLFMLTKQQDKQIVDFFYSSNDANIVPFRISLITGGYTGKGRTENEFTELLELLVNSTNLKKDSRLFLERLHNEE